MSDLRDSIRATRSMLKASQRTLRATLQTVNDLERRLDDLENAEPLQEAERNNGNHEAAAALTR